MKISLKFVPKSRTDNMSAPVQVEISCRTGDKPLFEPLVTQFSEAYTSSGLNELSIHNLK